MAQSRTKGLPQYKGSALLHGLLVPLIFLEAAAIIAQAIFLARAISFLFNGSAIQDVWRDAALFLLTFILRYLFAHAQKRLAERYSKNTADMLRSRLLRTFFEGDLSLAQKKGTGHLVTLIMDGVDQVKNYLEIISIRMISTMIIPVIIVIYVWTIDHTSAIILIVTVPISILFMILLGKTAQAKADKQYAAYQRLSNYFIDSLKGLETLVFLGESKEHAKKIDKVNEDYRKTTMKTLRIAFLSSFALDFFTSISIAFVAVGLGLRLIDGEMDLLPALTILILAPEYFLPIKQVGTDYHATLDGQVAMTEINEVLEEGRKSENDNRDVTADTGFVSMRGENVDLALNETSVVMDEEKVLHPLTLNIPQGWTGIIGPSGAGKTTLISLLAGRIIPESGRIKLGDKTLKSLDYSGWYEQIAYIPQQPYIFPLTLADNVRFYEPEASDEAIEQVIKDIGLTELIQDLPRGIHEFIGEGGRMLSGGQEQRVAIARALLSNKSVILLDEPTAHLDIETEYDLKQVMKRVFRDKRVILATHRLHWMNDMNHIIMLENGQVAESGTQAQLMEKQAAYYHYVNWQKEHKA